MSTPHYLVFIGPTASLSTELNALGKAQGVTVIAQAAGKRDRGITDGSIARALAELKVKMDKDDRHREEAILSVWAYQPSTLYTFGPLWDAFGKSAWIEMVPASLTNQNGPTFLHILQRLPIVVSLVHEVAFGVYRHRKTSPLPIPFENFKSKSLRDLMEYWYPNLELDALKKTLEETYLRFRGSHTRGDRSHYDDRSLRFSPAPNTQCHGQAHPTGACARCFVGGRFRFGAALYPGFHYDVTPADRKLLDCTLVDCDGIQRDMRPERRDYINIFSNDHLLPTK